MIEKEYNLEQIVPIITELFNNGRNATIGITGHSMAPLLYNKKSSVILSKCNPEKIKKYDILFYKRKDGSYVLHRAIKVNDNTVNCCGDNETQVEKCIKKQDVLGVVVAFRRKKKLHSCKNVFYKIYCFLWVALRHKRHDILDLNKKLRGKKK